MLKVMAAIEEFFAGSSLWVYLFIFVGRLFDVSAATIRIVLINRGERLVGSLMAFFEITVWLFVARSVLSGDITDPVKILVYAVAFAMGTFLGSWLEEKLALGLSSVQIVVSSHEDAEKLRVGLHDNGFGATSIDVHGSADDRRFMFITYVRRRSVSEVFKIVNQCSPDAVVTISDVKTQRGGYIHAVGAKKR